MAIAPTGAPDLAAIKQRQQATWASGDYHMIGTQILIVAELLIESLDVHSTERVLDVATGSGNAALAAARRGCEVVGIDYVPALLERARGAPSAEGVTATFVDGDAEALPFEDDTLRRGHLGLRLMFAPDQERTAAELARVCTARRQDRARHPHARGLHRPPVQGRSASTSRRPPASAPRSSGAPRSAFASCSADSIAELRVEKRHYAFRYRSPRAWVDYWRRYYGPTLKAFEAVGEEGARSARS